MKGVMWGVYGRTKGGELCCIRVFDTREKAVDFVAGSDAGSTELVIRVLFNPEDTAKNIEMWP